MDKVYYNGLMVASMMENGFKENNREQAQLSKMVKQELESGTKVILLNGLIWNNEFKNEDQ